MLLIFLHLYLVLPSPGIVFIWDRIFTEESLFCCSAVGGRNMLLWWFLGLAGSIVHCRGQVSKCDDFTDLDFRETFMGTNLNVKLLLFTRANLDCGRELSHLKLMDQPLFQLTRPTAFVIHGYQPTGAPPVWVGHIVRLLAAQEDMNILVVDWNRGAANLNYYSAVANTRKAAENITAFIQNIQENGALLSSVHLIGVSLGAHVAGFVGAMLKGKIGRITALDPAGPLFSGTPPEERLDPTDAQFVDVLHTDTDALGYRGPLGHIDFYANGGADQPGCPKTIFSGKSYFVCDHQRSVFLYLCSLNKTCNITAYPCSSYHDFLDGRCLQCESFKPASCPIVGYHASKWKDSLLRLGQTKVYFSTTAVSPYCKTNYKVDIVTWNQYTRWGIVVIKLHSGRRVVEARIDHKLSKFEQYTATRLLAQFDEDLNPVQKITLCFLTGNMIGPRYKMRLLRIRLTPLEKPDRPQLCRYDMILEENMEVSFRPMACDGSRN
ncbi:lipase member H isoform X1 [Anguilla anguilla]|uniref:lipase member H isoform X1 n=1 Tax=Anguilla anguilla TaxID=7936 RepID=UPI0015A9D724|nr:lipase member H isoform X1 [Anguilla anguilla]